MNVLTTGGSSLLGKYLLETAPVEANVIMTWYTNFSPGCSLQLDVCNQSQVRYVFGRVKPNLVIHCAAVGDVDYAERNYTEVEEINLGGTRNVLAAAKDYNAKVILTSTNAVFAGDDSPYVEDSPRIPINAYGKIRKRVEDEVMQSSNWLIVRLFLLYGWPPPGARTNWAETIIKRLSAGQHTKLVNDTYWQPTYAADAAQAIWMLSSNRNQVYHVAGQEKVTLFQFGKQVARMWGMDESLLEPVNSNSFSTIAPRPVDSTYDLSKLHNLGIFASCVQIGLQKMFIEGQKHVSHQCMCVH